LRQDYPLFANQDTQIIIIGPDNARAFSLFWDLRKIPFIGLPDPDHTVSTLYNQEVNIKKFGRMPAQVIVDKQGAIRFIHYSDAMNDIAKNEELLKILEKINNEVVNVSSI
jgi:peroxiredoxin